MTMGEGMYDTPLWLSVLRKDDPRPPLPAVEAAPAHSCVGLVTLAFLTLTSWEDLVLPDRLSHTSAC